MVSHTQAQANRATMKKLLVAACMMFGFGFALVPFYEKLCEVLGVNEIARADTVKNTQVDTSRWLTVQFDVNLRNDLPWTFRALEKSVRFHPGELVHVMFEVSNNSDRPITGQAVPSYGPQLAGRYFKKLDCFCFTQQTLQPGEVRQMPVVFAIDNTIPADLNLVTMSYTFFQVEGRGSGAG
jgi:cytochrome c oxidase assembly protein subunit 11